MATEEVLSDNDLAVIERECDSHEPPFLHDIRLLVREVRRHRAHKLAPAEIESLEFARYTIKRRRPTFDIAGAEQSRYDDAIAVLDKLIDTAVPDANMPEPTVPEVVLNAMTITDDQIRALMATADRDTRKICEVALRPDDAKTRGAFLMKARRKGQARARLAEILNTRSIK
jgi:hypothetical protein